MVVNSVNSAEEVDEEIRAKLKEVKLLTREGKEQIEEVRALSGEVNGRAPHVDATSDLRPLGKT